MNIELRGISKRFGPVKANQDIDLQIRAGEVLGLLGENGAGKSTLMNILSGLYRQDSGEILIDGDAGGSFDGPGDSIEAGIGMVHQHFMLVPVFSVVENVILGVEPTRGADYLDLDAARAQVQDINNRYGMDVPTEALIEDLPVGIQQRVEILKVLFRSADVLILDEPTAVLTPQEVEEFFGIVRALRDAGKAIVFITHKLHEILEIADRVSVLRQGEIVGDGDPSQFSEADLAEMMVGRPVSFSVGRGGTSRGAPVLELTDVSLFDDKQDSRLTDVSMLSMRARSSASPASRAMARPNLSTPSPAWPRLPVAVSPFAAPTSPASRCASAIRWGSPIFRKTARNPAWWPGFRWPRTWC